MIQTITDAMRLAEERPLHWSELPEAPDTYPEDERGDPPDDIDDGPELCGNCGYWPARCACDRLYSEDRERDTGDAPFEPCECGAYPCACDRDNDEARDMGDDDGDLGIDWEDGDWHDGCIED